MTVLERASEPSCEQSIHINEYYYDNCIEHKNNKITLLCCIPIPIHYIVAVMDRASERTSLVTANQKHEFLNVERPIEYLRKPIKIL